MATRQPSMRDRDEGGDGEMEMREQDRHTHREIWGYLKPSCILTLAIT